MTRSKRWVVLQRVVVAAVVVASLFFFARALTTTWGEADGRAVPDFWRFALAGLAAMLATLSGAAAWSRLVGSERTSRHVAGFLAALMGKYVPGGVLQAAGQVSIARSDGEPTTRGVTAVGLNAVVNIVAGCCFAAILSITWVAGSGPARGLAILAVVALIALRREWIVRVVRRIPRADPEALPSQDRILVAWLAGVAALLAAGLAYALLLDAIEDVPSVSHVVVAFAAAWTAGFVVAFLPAGLGVREAVLVALLADDHSSAAVISAAAYHRLVWIVVEGAMAGVGIAVLAARRRARSSAEPDRE